jgi:peptidoglycan hydrolase-like protein with peptidoglycan-binding domain
VSGLQQFPRITTGAVGVFDSTNGPTRRRHAIRRRLIALLMTLLMVFSFFMMTGRANAASAPQYPGHAISYGSTGKSVELIQAALNRYGAHLLADGKIWPLTRATVIRFQRAHGLKAHGIIGPITKHALFKSLGFGSTGKSVELIQAALNRYGAHLVVDGIFGPLTQAAVIRFQRAHRLKADGIVGSLTWRALFNSSSGSGPTAGYINPIQPGLWAPARTDQGVDWLPLQPNTPVLAIGAGVVTFSSLHSYWVGGGNITYKLTSGPKSGLYIYVTEHLTSVLPVGSVITPGEVIATAQPGYPWTEWGWAKPPGTGSYAPAVPYSGKPDGNPTQGGLAMARFFRELGAMTLQDPGPGPDMPY